VIQRLTERSMLGQFIPQGRGRPPNHAQIESQLIFFSAEKKGNALGERDSLSCEW
jgi:hypothetical protein